MNKSLLFLALSFGASLLASQEVKTNETQTTEKTFVVTAAREKQDPQELPLAIGKVDGDELNDIKPGHPSEALNRISGVHINNLGGESHFTAIRNGLSTGADYLFLENGVPTRSTGFFNHNALYEINVPQASAIEVIKGPGTALYGSDALHGVINVLSGNIPEERLIKLNGEYGQNGWIRHLLTYGDRLNENHAFRLDLNTTSSEGWRDSTDYSRHSATIQHLWTPADDFSAKTVFTWTQVDQSLASGLSSFDYLNNARNNYYRISGRDVESFRLSTKFKKIFDEDSDLTFTPYYRNSVVKGLVPNWRLSTSAFRPNGELWNSGFRSLGAQLKYRQAFDAMNATLYSGVDFDYSPGKNKREQTLNNRDFNADGNVYFNSFSKTGVTLYDYDVTYSSISPYLQYEFFPVDRLRIEAGLRYDYSSYDHSQNLDFVDGVAGRAGVKTGDIQFQQLSPKLAMSFALNEDHNIYASYRRGFRAPSSNDIFAAPASHSTLELDPTTIDSYEIGLKGQITEDFFYDLAVYYMDKKDDIITYRNPNDPSQRFATNNGRTSHRGVELQTTTLLTDEWTLKTAASYSEHKYEEWNLGTAAFFGAPSGKELEGNRLERAPRTTANVSLGYTPEYLNGANFELELVHVGSTEVDSKNTTDYQGHQLINFRTSVPVTENLRLYGRVMNLTDRRHSVSTSSSSSTPYRPGAPRTLFVGFELTY